MAEELTRRTDLTVRTRMEFEQCGQRLEECCCHPEEAESCGLRLKSDCC